MILVKMKSGEELTPSKYELMEGFLILHIGREEHVFPASDLEKLVVDRGPWVRPVDKEAAVPKKKFSDLS